MNDITREQADLITDLESYKTVTGAKRFKRTKEEMELGLSPEDALKVRLTEAKGISTQSRDSVEIGIAQAKAGKLNDGPKSLRASTSRNGNITISIRPARKVDADYFEHVPNGKLEIVLDEHWYKWYDQLMNGPFEGDSNKLLKFILDQGIGEVLTKCHFPEDVKNMEGVRQVEETVLKTAGP